MPGGGTNFLTIHARNLTLADKARVAALVASCFEREAEDGLPGDDAGRELIPWGRVVAVVAVEVQERVTSALLVTHAPWTVPEKYAFERVCTTAAERGQGYGRQLLRHALQRFSPAVLHVDRGPSHDRLVRMYRRAGFVVMSQSTADTMLSYSEVDTY